MERQMSETAGWTTVGVVSAIAFAAIIFFIVQGVMDANALTAAVKTACIENGGTWVDYQQLCIAAGSVVK
jgi:hypothetical protein